MNKSFLNNGRLGRYAVLSLGSAGTVEGTTYLAKAGETGVKGAGTIARIAGVAMGGAAVIISQEVQSDAPR